MSGQARRSLYLIIALLAVVLPLLIGAGFVVRGLVANAFAVVGQTRAAREQSLALLRLQLDEETGIRGFAAVHDRLFLEPYTAARGQFNDTAVPLRDAVNKLRLVTALSAIADARATNATWIETVATPLLGVHVAHPSLIQRRGKNLVDRFRADIATVNSTLLLREQAVNGDADRAINRILLLVVGAVVFIGLLAAVFFRQQSGLASRLEAERLRSVELSIAYATEKRIADTLQGAFSQRPLPSVPMLRFSAMYVPATDEAKVGGDWYDALELANERVLFAIGDVAGHGLDAAVAMSRARQALITSALLEADPASVLERVNRELVRERAPMVTAVVGFADSRSYEFIYAIAGHPPPLLLEPGRAPQILECGALPLATMATVEYRSYRVQTVPGAMLVLYTDGAVEHSRDVLAGEEMLVDAVARARADPTVEPATAIHRAIFEGRPAGDDVAILTIGFESKRAPGLTISAEQGSSSFSGRLGQVSEFPSGTGAKRRAFRAMLRGLASDREAS